MIREREVAAQICHHWREELESMAQDVARLAEVLRDDESDDCSHEIKSISETQARASRLQEACNQMRSGIGRAFPTAAAPSSTEDPR